MLGLFYGCKLTFLNEINYKLCGLCQHSPTTVEGIRYPSWFEKPQHKYTFNIFLIINLNMFTHNYKSRFDQGLLQNNILMTQIRAEKKIYSSKNTQLFSHRDDLQSTRAGKKVFQDILSRPSLSPSAK